MIRWAFTMAHQALKKKTFPVREMKPGSARYEAGVYPISAFLHTSSCDFGIWLWLRLHRRKLLVFFFFSDLVIKRGFFCLACGSCRPMNGVIFKFLLVRSLCFLRGVAFPFVFSFPYITSPRLADTYLECSNFGIWLRTMRSITNLHHGYSTLWLFPTASFPWTANFL